MSAFADITASYVSERRSVGVGFDKGERAMRKIAALHREMGCPQHELPKELVEAWCALRPGESETNRLARVSQVRCLAEWMVRMGYAAYVAPRGQGWLRRGSYEPHIFTNDEDRALFEASGRLSGDDPCCQRAQAALVLRLLYSTGIRCGEACSLGKADVDLAAGVVTVRHAKNDKDRLVPLHLNAVERMRAFERSASLAHPQYGSHDGFWSLPEGRPLTTDYVYGFFRDALWEAGISHGGRGKGPRVHDLRNAALSEIPTFA